MKEQVKEWIVDKNLTIDSFDSIMIGVIYNSEHNTLDDPDVRKWIGMHPSEFREMLPPNLNDNQKDLVLWMQENECLTDDPLEPISDLFLESTPSEHFPNLPLSCVAAAYQSLNKKQKLELVQKYLEQYLGREEE
ncbi:hypothetical protein [Enterococcus italicus]|uniref:hypothetical protein n=1 Tax=Enterococcus italicus TaxID=246144 RepID=UPI003F481FDB